MRIQKSSAAMGFTPNDQVRLKKALSKVSDKRTFLRIQAVLLVAEGMDIVKVAKVTDKTVRSIYNWVASYLKQHRIDVFYDAPKSGRPLAAPGITDKRILKELNRNPMALGYTSNVWTVALLAQHLSVRYSCEIRPFTLYRRMKAIGLHCKRPRYGYAEKDPHRTQKKGSHRAKAKPHAAFSGSAL